MLVWQKPQGARTIPLPPHEWGWQWGRSTSLPREGTEGAKQGVCPGSEALPWDERREQDGLSEGAPTALSGPEEPRRRPAPELGLPEGGAR